MPSQGLQAAVRLNGVAVNTNTVSISAEPIRVNTAPGSVEADPEWIHRDAKGHWHYYSADRTEHYPTLMQQEGATWWCEDCRDTHTEHYWACRVCAERIAPGTRTASPVLLIEGPKRIVIDIDRWEWDQHPELVVLGWHDTILWTTPEGSCVLQMVAVSSDTVTLVG